MGEGMEELFERIDANGGWPLGKNWITMRHDSERSCHFTETERNDGWNTSVYHADDYYLWKISDSGIKKLTHRIAGQMASRAKDWISSIVLDKKAVQPKYSRIHRY